MRPGWLLVLPSLISLSRLVFAAVFIVVGTPAVRAALVVASAFTDFLDGWIARVGRAETRAGAIIDPITDRLFMVTALAVLVSERSLTVVQCVLLLLRDVATSIGFFVALSVSWLRQVHLRARFPGKLVTVLQFLAVIAALVYRPGLQPLVLLVAALSVLAIADYTLALWRARATA